jgi:capsular exopolysaccharide synthesis family protein
MNNQNPQNPFLEQEIDLREYARVLYERRWMIISFTVIVCTLALIRVFMMKPVYEATTRVLIQRSAPKVVNIEEVAPDTYRGREYYQTQYKILKSRVLADRVDEALGGYIPWSSWTGRKGGVDDDLTESKRISALLESVEIRPLPNTQLVKIAVEDPDPQLAARIADLWGQSYISYILDTKFQASQHAAGWLQDKIKDAKSKLEESEQRLQRYRKQHDLVMDLDEDEDTMTDKLLKKKADLEIELSEKKEYYKAKHPEIMGIKSEIQSVSEKILSEREQQLEAGEMSIEYKMLKREVATNRDIYNALLKRVGETEVTGKLNTTNINIVDRAEIPESPVKPRKKIDMLIALFIGLLGGGGLAFFMESLDQSIKSPEDIKNRLGLPVLASVAVPKDPEEIQKDPELISFRKPRSTISESYRSLRTSIMFTAVEHPRKTILFTSSVPQEGKTTTAINTAIVMAQAGERTILLDADLRQPRIEKTFNLSVKHGMTDILAGSESIDEVIHHSDIDNLDIIACGALPPNPSELLGSKKMDTLLDELKHRYDRVIIDTPPVLAVTDAVVLSGKVDGAVVVVKANETNRNAVLKTKEFLSSIQTAHVLGTVLNMVETGRSGGHYYYYKYYGKKHGKYGNYDKGGKENDEQ